MRRRAAASAAARRWRAAASTRRACSKPRPPASSSCLVLLGADPLADFPDSDLARRALAACRHGHRRRHVPQPLGAAGRRRAAGGRLRREGAARTTNIEGRVTNLEPEGHAARHGPRRLDDRRRAGRTARRRPRLRVVERDQRRDRRRVPALRRRSPPPRLAADRDGVLVAGSRRRTVAAGRHRRCAAATATATTSASSVSRKLYDAGVAVAALAVAGRRWPPARRSTCNRSTSTASARPHGTAVEASSGPRPRSCCRSRPTTRRAARLGLGAVQPARRRRSATLDRRDGAGHRRPGRDPVMRRSTALARSATRSHVGRRRLTVVLIVVLKVLVAFVVLLVAHDAHGLVRAQGHRRHAEPHRPEQGRPVRHPADAGRRHQAVLQGRPDLPERADRFVFQLAPYLALRAGVPDRSRSSRSAATSATASDGVVTSSATDLPAAGRPADRDPARPRPAARSPSTA